MEKRFKEGGASLRQEKGGYCCCGCSLGGIQEILAAQSLGWQWGGVGGVDKAAKLRIKPGHRRATALSGGK